MAFSSMNFEPWQHFGSYSALQQKLPELKLQIIEENSSARCELLSLLFLLCDAW